MAAAAAESPPPWYQGPGVYQRQDRYSLFLVLKDTKGRYVGFDWLVGMWHLSFFLGDVEAEFVPGQRPLDYILNMTDADTSRKGATTNNMINLLTYCRLQEGVSHRENTIFLRFIEEIQNAQRDHFIGNSVKTKHALDAVKAWIASGGADDMAGGGEETTTRWTRRD